MTATPLVGSTFFGLDISQLVARVLSIRRKISKRVLLLEFRSDALLLAEASLTPQGVRLSHISSFTLPPDALDRGVPAEPLKMAGLIQEFCTEKKIPAHRVAVVLSPELAFQRLLELPASLTKDQAREYVLNPANGLQIPFPLTQTDFDLFPVSMPIEKQDFEKHLYMLTAIPEFLVDQVVETLQAADLELQLLEIGSHSQIRNHAADVITLAPQQVDLVLELLPNYSNLMLVSSSGLLGSERLAAIRNLPEADINQDQLTVALDAGLTAEDVLLKSESYLPLSDLDLRNLASDLRSSFERFHVKAPDVQIRRLILTGVNSSHPFLADLLGEMLGLQVVLSQSCPTTGLAGLSMGGLLLKADLGRLTGLALGLLSKDQLLACSLDAQNLDYKNSSARRNDAVAISDLLSSSEAQSGLDLVAVHASPSDLLSEPADNDSSSSKTITSIEVESAIDLDNSPALNTPVDAFDQPDDVIISSIVTIEPELKVGPDNSDKEFPQIASDEKKLDSLPEAEWPTISSEAESAIDLDNSPAPNTPVDVLDQPDDVIIPSIVTIEPEPKVGPDNSDEEFPEIASDQKKLDLLPESEWPTISSPNNENYHDQEDRDFDGSSGTSWPSITLDSINLEEETPPFIEDEECEDPSIIENDVAVQATLNKNGSGLESLIPLETADYEMESIDSTSSSDYLGITADAHDESVENLNSHDTFSSQIIGPRDQPQSTNRENLVSATLPDETIIDKQGKSLIPDLTSSTDTAESCEERDNDEVKESDDSTLNNALGDLGELRFAEGD